MKIEAPTLKKIFTPFRKFLSTHKIIGFILLALISLVYIGAILYFYAWEVKISQDLPIKKISINSDLYQKMMDDFAKREAIFLQEGDKAYKDPFYK